MRGYKRLWVLNSTVHKYSSWISSVTNAQGDNLRRLDNISVAFTPSGEQVTQHLNPGLSSAEGINLADRDRPNNLKEKFTTG
jgi:hypothetical protein